MKKCDGKEKMKRIYPYMIIVYALLSFLFRLVYLFVPLREVLTDSIASVISRLLWVFGVCLMMTVLIFDRSKLKAASIKCTCLLFVAAVISAVYRYQYGFVHNVYHIIRILIDMIVIYSIPWIISRDGQKRLLLCLHSVGSLLFVPVFLYGFHQFWNLEHIVVGGKNQGWFEGRLFTITVSLYAGTAIAALLLWGSVCMFWKAEKKALKLLYLTEIVIYSLYIVLSDTRTIFVGIAAGWFVIWMWGGAEDKLFAKRPKKIYVFLLYILMILLLGVGVKGMRYILINAAYHHVESQDNGSYTGVVDSIEESGETTDPVEALDRPKNRTLSSRRVTIWKCYAEILLDKPSNLLFGFSPYGYVAYIYEHYFDTYVVSEYLQLYPEIGSELKVYATHNAYLHVMVTTGVLGIAAMIGCILRPVSAFLEKEKKGKLSIQEVFFGSLIVMMLSFAMFETDIFMQVTPLSFVFWLITGMLMNRLEMSNGSESGGAEPLRKT